MFGFKDLKMKAYLTIKKHYVLFMILCLIAAFLGVSYRSSITYVQSTNPYKTVSNTINDKFGFSANDVLDRILKGQIESGKEISKEYLNEAKDKETQIGIIQFERTKGVLSKIINTLSSGHIFIIFFEAINSVIENTSLVTSIFIVINALLFAFVTTIVSNIYKIVFYRTLMESRTYEKITNDSFFYLYKIRKTIKVYFTMLIVSIYKVLWNITIIGGIIKSFSYAMVPYIVSENPDISATDAIYLSREMMYGHKFELLKLQLSFIPWYILGYLSFGFSEIFYSNPFHQAVMIEYYISLRDEAKNKGISYANLLSDKFLFETAPVELLKESYADVVEIMNDNIVLDRDKNGGIRAFLENNFGIIFKFDKKELDYNNAIEQEDKVNEYKNVLLLKQYPLRLTPNQVYNNHFSLGSYHYLRHYSIGSLLLMFFIFSFVGYLWEVSLHLVSNGTFVNRGTMHGPWLPIYGAGCLAILILLFRFRHKPGLHAFLTIIMCGTIEYFTHYYLEITKGIMWWNYDGFFMNINGRICAEGLLVFMVGGMAVVYFIAPILDNLLRKIKSKQLLTIGAILLIIYIADIIYSHYYPNVGEGIADYIKILSAYLL